MAKYFMFNGISSEGKLAISAIGRSIAPEINDVLIEINGRPGAIDFGGRIGVRYITVEVAIIGRNPEDLEMKKREIAAWLVTEDPKPLIFSDEPEIEYRARLTGKTDIEHFFHIGKGKLTFLCADPFRYEAKPRYFQKELANGGSIEVINPGTLPASPTIHITNVSKAPINLCVNPHFEIDTSAWVYQNTGGSSGAFVRDTSRKYSGTASGKLTKLNEGEAIPRVYFTISGYEAGRVYLLEAYVYSEVDDGLTIYVEEETSDYQYPQVSKTAVSGTAGQWNKISMVVTPTDSNGTMFVFFEARKPNVYSSWIDEVFFADVTDGYGVLRNPSLTLGDKTIMFDGEMSPNETLTLDFESWTATIDGRNVLAQIVGDFFTVPTGNCTIQFNAGEGKARIGVSIRGRWL